MRETAGTLILQKRMLKMILKQHGKQLFPRQGKNCWISHDSINVVLDTSMYAEFSLVLTRFHCWRTKALGWYLLVGKVERPTHSRANDFTLRIAYLQAWDDTSDFFSSFKSTRILGVVESRRWSPRFPRSPFSSVPRLLDLLNSRLSYMFIQIRYSLF